MKKTVPHPLAPEGRAVGARDVGWLIASLAIVVVPHMLRAPWWLTLLTLCLFGWRLYLSLYRAPLPSRWLVLAVAMVGMLGLWFEYRSLFGRTPGILLLVLLSGLKLLETRTHRDAAMAVFLGYFLVIANFLYTQSIPTALFMCGALLVLTTTLVGFSAPQRAVGPNLRTAGILLLHAVPIALVLFVLFPRVQGPLWGLPQDAYAGLSGLTDTMAPGNLSRLVLSDATAFRAEFHGARPPHPLLYWRGPVLWDFDGRTWSVGRTLLARYEPPSGGRTRFRYDVVLEPHNRSGCSRSSPRPARRATRASASTASCWRTFRCARACATRWNRSPTRSRGPTSCPPCCGARCGCPPDTTRARWRWRRSGAMRRAPTPRW